MTELEVTVRVDVPDDVLARGVQETGVGIVRRINSGEYEVVDYEQ